MRFYPVTKDSAPELKSTEPHKAKTRHSKNPVQEMHVGWVMDSREHTGRRDSCSESVGSQNSLSSR